MQQNKYVIGFNMMVLQISLRTHLQMLENPMMIEMNKAKAKVKKKIEMTATDPMTTTTTRRTTPDLNVHESRMVAARALLVVVQALQVDQALRDECSMYSIAQMHQ